jgi:protein kinase C-binding protein 1
MRLLEVDQLCVLLKHALGRMKTVSGVEPFTKPVDPTEFPSYKDYITCPMDLSTMEKNIKKKRFGSTEAFLAAAKWILHNCIIFNSAASKLTSIAKSLVKVCKHEMQVPAALRHVFILRHRGRDTVSWGVFPMLRRKDTT